MRVPLRRLGAAFVGVALAAVVAGCSDAASAEDDPVQLSNQRRLEILGWAEDDELVSEEQLAVLRQEEITFEDYAAANSRLFACLEEAGLEPQGLRVERHLGNDQLTYDVGGVATEADFEAMQRCEAAHTYYLDFFWQTATPRTLDWERRRQAALREPLMECLADMGVDFASDATHLELTILAHEHFRDLAGDLWYDDDFWHEHRHQYDCLARVGADEWDDGL